MLKPSLHLMLGPCHVLTCIINECFRHSMGYFQDFLLLCIRAHVVPGKLQPVLFSPGQVLFVLLPRRHLWVLWIFRSQKEQQHGACSVSKLRGIQGTAALNGKLPRPTLDISSVKQASHRSTAQNSQG